MTDTPNQNPVQSQSDNPFFRPVTNDPAPSAATLATDPLTTPQSPPAPATTIADPLTTMQPSTLQTDTNVAVSQSLPSTINDNVAMPVVADTMPTPVMTDTLPVDKVNLSPVEPVVTSPDAMPSSTNSEVPAVQPVEPAFTVPAMPETTATLSTETNTSEVVNTESLQGSVPVTPPQLTPEVGATIAPSIDSPVTLSPMEPVVNNITEEPKPIMPDLNSLNTTPDQPVETKPMDVSLSSDTNQVGSLPEIPNLNNTMTDSLPSLDAMAQDTNMPVGNPVTETPSVVTADPVSVQPEPAPTMEVASSLPPLEPVVQPEPVETPVVAPIAQEVTPVATAEAQETKTEPAPVNETVPAPAGKMKNLVLLLGVLVVGIVALVLGIIVASTQ